tara:strand:+ start:350 stop:469 length:120 start_codon:yes stop_codon:yes gene_type:complete
MDKETENTENPEMAHAKNLIEAFDNIMSHFSIKEEEKDD